MCNFNRIFNDALRPTDKAKRLKNPLLVIVWCGVALGILYFVTVAFLSSGLIEILLAVLLYIASANYIFYIIMIYLFAQMLNLIGSFCYMGGIIQHQLIFKSRKTFIIGTNTNMSIYSDVVCLLAVAYYVVALVFVFMAYKEYKGMYKDAIEGRVNNSVDNQNDHIINHEPVQRSAFTGRSQRIGGNAV